jgi:hypothetical protein
MATYTQVTKQFGDLWVDALKRAEEAVASAAKTRQTQPRRPIRQTTLSRELPTLHEVVEANFDLAERVLKAQKHYALKAIEAAFPEAAKPAAKAHAEPRKPAPRRKTTRRTTRPTPQVPA